jgi:hypothetical protein
MAEGKNDDKRSVGLADRLSALESVGEALDPVEKLLSTLSEDEAAILRRLLSNSHVSVSSIHRELKNAGHRIGRDTLGAYRAKLAQR